MSQNEKSAKSRAYTVKAFAKLSGVSAKTIRYYDSMKLLKPAKVTEAGYRIYGEAEVDKMQHILFYRHLGLSLKAMGEIINSDDFDEISALRHHKKELESQKAHLDSLILTVEKTLLNKERGIQMNDTEKFDSFKEKLIQENEEKYGEEIREKYGDERIDQSNAAMMKMSEVQYAEFISLQEAFKKALAKAAEGGDPSSEVAKQVYQLHKRWIIMAWGGKTAYSPQAHLGLCQMYLADERFHHFFDHSVENMTFLIKLVEKEVKEVND